MNTLEKLDLIKTDNHIGICFVLGCEIYKHEKYGFYITDYDIHKDERLSTSLYISFNNDKSMVVTEEFLLRTNDPFNLINQMLNS